MSQLNFIKEEIQRLFGNKPWLSSKDLVTLGISQSEETLSRWRRRGEGPQSYRFSAGKFLYEKNSVLEWMESCRLPIKKQEAQSQLVNCEKKLLPSTNQTSKMALPNLIQTSDGSLICLN